MVSLKKKMEKAISSAVALKALVSKFSSDLFGQVTREVSTFESDGVRGKHLQACYDFLMSIPPTSVESERAFSASGLICTKLRTRLNDDTIDALSFLNAHFQKY